MLELFAGMLKETLDVEFQLLGSKVSRKYFESKPLEGSMVSRLTMSFSDSASVGTEEEEDWILFLFDSTLFISTLIRLYLS